MESLPSGVVVFVAAIPYHSPLPAIGVRRAREPGTLKETR
jgi:hypothetical protein